MSDIQFGKLITTSTYHAGEEIAQKQEYEVSQYATRDTILKDIITSLTLLTSGETHKLELCINLDSKGRYRIVKKWGVE